MPARRHPRTGRHGDRRLKIRSAQSSPSRRKNLPAPIGMRRFSAESLLKLLLTRSSVDKGSGSFGKPDRRLKKHFPDRRLSPPWRSPAWRWRASPISPREEAARIKFEATADDALNRIESRVDLHLSLLRDDGRLLHGARRPGFGRRVQDLFRRARRRQEFRGPARHRLCSAGEARRRGRARARHHRAAGRREADLSACLGRRLAHAGAAVRAARPDQADRHRLRHVQRSATARGYRKRRIETGEPRATGPCHARPADRRRETFPAFCCSRQHGAARRRAESQPLGLLLCRVPHAGPVQIGARTSFRRCRSMPKSSTAQSSPRTCCSSSEAPPAALGDGLRDHAPVARRRTALDHRIPADSGFHAPVLARRSRCCSACSDCCSPPPSRSCSAIRRAPIDAMSKLQENAEKSLLEKDLMLQEMKHRIKNSITTRAGDRPADGGERQGYRRVHGVLLGAAAGDGRIAGHADALALAEGRSRRTAAHRACAGVRQGTAGRHARRAAKCCSRRR